MVLTSQLYLESEIIHVSGKILHIETLKFSIEIATNVEVSAFTPRVHLLMQLALRVG